MTKRRTKRFPKGGMTTTKHSWMHICRQVPHWWNFDITIEYQGIHKCLYCFVTEEEDALKARSPDKGRETG